MRLSTRATIKLWGDSISLTVILKFANPEEIHLLWQKQFIHADISKLERSYFKQETEKKSEFPLNLDHRLESHWLNLFFRIIAAP